MVRNILTIFGHFGEKNDLAYPKAMSTTTGRRIKVNSVLGSYRLNLQNEILILNIGHDMNLL